MTEWSWDRFRSSGEYRVYISLDTEDIVRSYMNKGGLDSCMTNGGKYGYV